MKVFVSADGDGIGQRVGRMSLADDVDGIRRVSQAIDLGNEIFKSWVLASGGDVVSMGGDECRLQVPADRLDELPRIRDQYADAVGATVSVGVGMKISEADQALLFAKAHGKDRIIFWSPQVGEYVRQLAEGDQRDEAAKLRDEYLGKSDGVHLDYADDRDDASALQGDALARVHLRPLGVVGGENVWLVDGLTVRDDHDVDFCEGGNPSRYAYIPRGEVWIDALLGPVDACATMVHELVEHRLMDDQGTSYDDAHDRANQLEVRFRDQNRDLQGIDVGLVRRFLDAHGYDDLGKAQPAMNPGGFAGHAIPSAPKVQKPVQAQGDHSQANDVYQMMDDVSRPAPAEPTHEGADFEEQFHQEASKQEAFDQQQAAAEAQARTGIRAQVAQTLQRVKQMAPLLEQLKQTAPQAYQSITEMAQVTIALARALAPTMSDTSANSAGSAQSIGQNPMSKAELPRRRRKQRKSEEHVPGAKELDSNVVGENAVHLDPQDTPPKADIDGLGKGALQAEPKPGARLKLPVGSQLDPSSEGRRYDSGKIKIRHGSGKEGWVGVRAGMVLSPDGHAVSSRSPEAG